MSWCNYYFLWSFHNTQGTFSFPDRQFFRSSESRAWPGIKLWIAPVMCPRCISFSVPLYLWPSTLVMQIVMHLFLSVYIYTAVFRFIIVSQAVVSSVPTLRAFSGLLSTTGTFTLPTKEARNATWAIRLHHPFDSSSNFSRINLTHLVKIWATCRPVEIPRFSQSFSLLGFPILCGERLGEGSQAKPAFTLHPFLSQWVSSAVTFTPNTNNSETSLPQFTTGSAPCCEGCE